MKNFLMLQRGIDVTPALLELALNGELWNRYRVRTFHEQSAHRVIDDIVLRYNPFGPGDDFVDAVCSRVAVVNYPPFDKLFECKKLVLGLMQRVQGLHLGRVFISRMAPGVGIPSHSDRIPPAEEAFPDRVPPAVYYDRYHVVLASCPGVQFTCGDEQVFMAPGELWWFNNEVDHSVANFGEAERIHLVVDIHHGKTVYEPPEIPEGRVN